MTSRNEFKDRHDPSPQNTALQDYVKKLERENRALKQQVGTDETLFDYVKCALQSFPAPEKVKYDKPKLRHEETHAVLVTTDQHAEETVLSEEMEGLASYNWSKFQYRLNKVGEKTIELVNIARQAGPVRYLDIWSLGDWFCGKIQPQEEAYGVEMPMPVAVPSVAKEFAQLLVKLSGHFEKIRVVCICGNHGREGRKPVFKMTADRNWDMSAYLIAQALTEQCSNIEWTIPRSIMTVVDVMGWNCLLTHSGEVNMNNRTPYYPIESTFDMEYKARAGTDKEFKYVFTGHWHHRAVLDDSIFLCPSLIGPSQFSRFKLHKRAAPAQLLGFFSEKKGLIEERKILL